ncbi:hypothetical protein [Sulfurospirillum deleyianum]|uniref:Uncharacterized protein n=1 Tax=Sulfurospirillum deleyianum (strain ATCC 51133 / DSM 6946 / 5175) TaxID=525898 RepID=D1B326_SULD5|nr:hypothetical protein [Sulfurospirillum deleyianum]ACZ12496.1 hypothetical protein Sdel_1478 [Sulfurospirillum deleyianum DSM 6946]
MRVFLLFYLFFSSLYAHPVSYSIDLHVSYNEREKSVSVACESDSRNKCGLHDFHLLNAQGEILKTASFPFMKASTSTTCPQKPAKMIFYLRQIPEHTYIVLFE